MNQETLLVILISITLLEAIAIVVGVCMIDNINRKIKKQNRHEDTENHIQFR